MIKVNGDAMDWRDGLSVQDILDFKKYKFPMLIVTVGDSHVPKEQYAATTVPDGAEVKVIHLLSGG